MWTLLSVLKANRNVQKSTQNDAEFNDKRLTADNWVKLLGNAVFLVMHL